MGPVHGTFYFSFQAGTAKATGHSASCEEAASHLAYRIMQSRQRFRANADILDAVVNRV